MLLDVWLWFWSFHRKILCKACTLSLFRPLQMTPQVSKLQVFRSRLIPLHSSLSSSLRPQHNWIKTIIKIPHAFLHSRLFLPNPQRNLYVSMAAIAPIFFLTRFKSFRFANWPRSSCENASTRTVEICGHKFHKLSAKRSKLTFRILFYPSQSKQKSLTALFQLSDRVFLRSKLVRHSAARVIAAIASIEIPLGTWDQLLPFLQQTCTSAQAAHREVGSFIMFTVLENIVEGFQQHMQGLFNLFSQMLADPESIEVRITTVRYKFCARHLLRHSDWSMFQGVGSDSTIYWLRWQGRTGTFPVARNSISFSINLFRNLSKPFFRLWFKLSDKP